MSRLESGLFGIGKPISGGSDLNHGGSRLVGSYPEILKIPHSVLFAHFFN
jgi:hypothetical protein